MAEHSGAHESGDDSVRKSNKLSTKKSDLESETVQKRGDTEASKDGLDDLLDSALKDFGKQVPEQARNEDASDRRPDCKSDTRTNEEKNAEPPPLHPDQEALFNQLFDSGGEAANFESLMSSVMAELGSDLGQDPSLNEDLTRLLQGGGAQAFPDVGAVPPSGGTTTSGPDTLSSTLGDTVNRLVQSAQDLKDGNIPEEELFRQMENMHLGDGTESEMMPMMQHMMQSLLSKEILYPSLREVVEKYPVWLDDNESRVEPTDYERYTKQFELMKRLCSEYESESPSDTADVQQQRMTRIMDLIQEMEGLGQPPKDIIGEGSTGLGLQFDSQGMPKVPGMPQGDQCSIM